MSQTLLRPADRVLFMPQKQAAKPLTQRLKVVSEYQPSGDQPTAIAELVAGVERGERDQVLLGVTGSGKTFTMAKVIEAVQKPDADPGAQQDAGRAALRRDEGLLPRQRGRVFRQLLRLLPAGGLRSAHRHLHREGRADQRADRPDAPRRHAGAAGAQRRRDRRLGLLHLRHRLGRDLRADGGEAGGRRARSTATRWPRRWSICSTAATTPPSSAARSACAAKSSTSSRAITRTAPGASRCSATRSRRSTNSTR